MKQFAVILIIKRFREENMKSLLNEAKAIEPEIIANRRYLHENPECGFDLKNTCRFVMKKLTSYGYKPSLIGRSGITANIGRSGGKTILLRADMDALPIEETTNLSFKSKNKNDHACGHDTHTAMLLGAAKLLKQHENELEGCVKLMFQPNEEGTAPDINGSEEMINAGILKNPDVDAAMSLHISSGQFKSGDIVTRKGAVMSSCDNIEIEITGKGTHGSRPQLGIDPINVACHIYEGLQNIIAREISCTDQSVITIGSLHAGNAANVIPDKAAISGTMRTVTETTRAYFKKRIDEICSYTCKAYNAKYTLKFDVGIPDAYNDPLLTEDIINYSNELLGYPCKLMEFPSGGSDDISLISHAVPTCYLFLGSGTPEEGYIYSHHNSNVIFNEKVFYIGTALYANSAIEWLRNHK